MQGVIHNGRDMEVVPAAQEGHNTGSIAICCGGRNAFTDMQMAALKTLCDDIHIAYNGTVTFHGHREVNPNKTCPNFNYRKVLCLNQKGNIVQ
jgi:N-acetyl-anhydromuramyl-L-alanine amidase AmpD